MDIKIRLNQTIKKSYIYKCISNVITKSKTINYVINPYLLILFNLSFHYETF